jgi:hypothetical protein
MTLWRLYLCDTLLQRLAQHLQDVVAVLRPFIQQEDAVVGPRHFARPQHLAGRCQFIRAELIWSQLREERGLASDQFCPSAAIPGLVISPHIWNL